MVKNNDVWNFTSLIDRAIQQGAKRATPFFFKKTELSPVSANGTQPSSYSKFSLKADH